MHLKSTFFIKLSFFFVGPLEVPDVATFRGPSGDVLGTSPAGWVELYAFYIEFKKVKFTAINFRGRTTNVKYFIQTQLLGFCEDNVKISSLPFLKITTKSTHFVPATKKIPILWIELQTNKIQKVSKPYKKDFFEKCEQRSNIIF